MSMQQNVPGECIQEHISQISAPSFFSALRLDSQVVDTSFTNEFAYDLLIKKKSTIHVTQFLSLHLPETKYQQLNRNLIYNALAGCKLWNKYLPTSKQPGVTTYVASVFNTISGGALADILCDVECEKQLLKEQRSKKNERWSMPENFRSEQIYGEQARELLKHEQKRFLRTTKQHPRVSKQLLTKSTTTKRDMYQKSALALIDLTPNDDEAIIHQVIHSTRKPRRYDAHATMKSFTIENDGTVSILFEFHTTVTKYAVTDSWALSRLSEMSNRLKARSFTNKTILNQIEGYVEYSLKLEVDERKIPKQGLLPYCQYGKLIQLIKKENRTNNKVVNIPDVIAQQSFDNFSEKQILKLKLKAQKPNEIHKDTVVIPFKREDDGTLSKLFYQCMVCFKIQQEERFYIYSCTHGACNECQPSLTVAECHVCTKTFKVVRDGKDVARDSNNTSMGSRSINGLEQECMAQQVVLETQREELNSQNAVIESVVREVSDLHGILLKVMSDTSNSPQVRDTLDRIQKSDTFRRLAVVVGRDPSQMYTPNVQQQQQHHFSSTAQEMQSQAPSQKPQFIVPSLKPPTDMTNYFQGQQQNDADDLFSDIDNQKNTFGKFDAIESDQQMMIQMAVDQDQNMNVSGISEEKLISGGSSDGDHGVKKSAKDVAQQLAEIKIESGTKPSNVDKTKFLQKKTKVNRADEFIKSVSGSAKKGGKSGTGK